VRVPRISLAHAGYERHLIRKRGSADGKRMLESDH
jgi:hypothetical protein